MHYLFDPVPLHSKPMIWEHKIKTVENFSGFYHWHQCCEVLIAHEGAGNVIVNQKSYELRRGMVFFFQPFQLHKVFANVSPEQPYVRSKTHFDPYEFQEKLHLFPLLLERFLLLWQGNHTFQAFDMGDSFAYVEHMLAVHEQNARSVGDHRAAEFELSFLLIVQLLNAVSLHLHPHLGTSTSSPRTFSYAEKVMQWIEEHYRDDIQLEDIAEAMHLSKYYVSRLFQNETGSTIPQYVTARRIKIACRLLQTTSYSIERIGIEVGIPNPSYFIRTFKKTVGTTPLKYRKMY
ncbi:AraC family transcriptional regulator [Paenibacillus sp.]|uniref:AraC family transcriptional regulator n=1 Tax=Paenibacillus sp. TaxID=58172 RepID=UPI00281206CE|nr:AraC family transcriptional regulator [Paenibacillus sp.]